MSEEILTLADDWGSAQSSAIWFCDGPDWLQVSEDSETCRASRRVKLYRGTPSLVTSLSMFTSKNAIPYVRKVEWNCGVDRVARRTSTNLTLKVEYSRLPDNAPATIDKLDKLAQLIIARVANVWGDLYAPSSTAYDARALRWGGMPGVRLNWLNPSTDNDAEWDQLWAILCEGSSYPVPLVEAELFRMPPFNQVLEVTPKVVPNLWNWLAGTD